MHHVLRTGKVQLSHHPNAVWTGCTTTKNLYPVANSNWLAKRDRILVTKTIYILNGPNLNLLGKREPEIYGADTLADVEAACSTLATELGLGIQMLQSNHEGVLIDWIHEARDRAAGIIINPAAFSHTSVAVLDALNTYDGPVLEVHISNIHKRESFRHHSYVSGRADGMIAGFGTEGYTLALRRMGSLLA